MRLHSTRIGDEVRLPEAAQRVERMGKLDSKLDVPSAFPCRAAITWQSRASGAAPWPIYLFLLLRDALDPPPHSAPIPRMNPKLYDPPLLCTS